jgi:hypothetical protein
MDNNNIDWINEPVSTADRTQEAEIKNTPPVTETPKKIKNKFRGIMILTASAFLIAGITAGVYLIFISNDENIMPGGVTEDLYDYEEIETSAEIETEIKTEINYNEHINDMFEPIIIIPDGYAFICGTFYDETIGETEWVSFDDHAVPFQLGIPFIARVDLGNETNNHSPAIWGFITVVQTTLDRHPSEVDVYIESILVDGVPILFEESNIEITNYQNDVGIRISLTNEWSDFPVVASYRDIGVFSKIEVMMAIVEYGTGRPDFSTVSAPVITMPQETTHIIDEIITVGSVSLNPVQIIYMNDFSNGLGGWIPRCGGSEPEHEHYGLYEVILETIPTADSPTGGQSLRISGRDRHWNGTYLDVTDIFKDSGKFIFEVLAWVRMPEDASVGRINLSYETHTLFYDLDLYIPNYNYFEDFNSDAGILSKYRLPVGAAATDAWWDDLYDTYPEGYVFGDWVLLHGTAVMLPSNYDKIKIYFDTIGGTPIEQVIYIDSIFIVTR